jgi:hypothetical protein
MKLKFIHTGIALALSTILMVSSCKKETQTATPATEDNTKYEASLLIDDADKSYMETNITGGTEDAAFTAENEGLAESYTFVETDMDDAGFKRGDAKRFFVCLKKLDLTDSQVVLLRRALKAYETCKAEDIRKHREAYEKLSDTIEHSRKELSTRLKLGKITKAQFEQQMKELRTHFEIALRRIKLSYAKTLRACYERYMRANKEILTERQWKAFVDCYR